MQFAVSFLGGLAYAFYSSWEASLVILSVVPFMTLSILFLVKITQSQTARSNESYSEAGSIVYTAVASIRTILSLNAVETMIDKFYAATTRAYEGAAGVVHLVGLANGLTMASYMLAYVSVTLFGSWLLYDAVRTSGCDPSGWVENKETCNPSAVNVFGSLMGISIAAAVLPQVAGTIESFTGKLVHVFIMYRVIEPMVSLNKYPCQERERRAIQPLSPSVAKLALTLVRNVVLQKFTNLKFPCQSMKLILHPKKVLNQN